MWKGLRKSGDRQKGRHRRKKKKLLQTHVITSGLVQLYRAGLERLIVTQWYPSGMTAVENLFAVTSLSSDRAEAIKKTYLLLGLCVGRGLCGGYLGAHSDALANLFTGWIGWILAMLLLNLDPKRVAIAVRHNPVLGVTALLADGFVSGLVLAPILRIASLYAPGNRSVSRC